MAAGIFPDKSGKLTIENQMHSPCQKLSKEGHQSVNLSMTQHFSTRGCPIILWHVSCLLPNFVHFLDIWYFVNAELVFNQLNRIFSPSFKLSEV